jgi:hypothetical protein
VVELGFLGAQELAPCGGVEEQVAHFHRGAPGMGGGLHLHLHIAALALGAGALTGAVVGIAGEGQARHGADTGQCLAAETQAADPFQVFQRFDLAGGMAGQCQGQLVGGDAGPVVADTDQLAAAGLHLDIHPGGAGVQAVFQWCGITDYVVTWEGTPMVRSAHPTLNRSDVGCAMRTITSRCNDRNLMVRIAHPTWWE